MTTASHRLLMVSHNMDRLKKTDEYDKAYIRAVHYLKFRPRSRMEIKRYLTEKKFLPDIISKTINKLEAKGYINDSEFARLWVENRLRFRPKGIFALTCELKNKGVTESIIDSTTKGINEKKSAWKAVYSKLNKWHSLEKTDFKKKIYAFLNRRGFAYSVCKDISDEAWKNHTKNCMKDY